MKYTFSTFSKVKKLNWHFSCLSPTYNCVSEFLSSLVYWSQENDNLCVYCNVEVMWVFSEIISNLQAIDMGSAFLQPLAASDGLGDCAWLSSDCFPAKLYVGIRLVLECMLPSDMWKILSAWSPHYILTNWANSAIFNLFHLMAHINQLLKFEAHKKMCVYIYI